MTFRLDQAVVDELQREADHNETSLNVLVNQILRRYKEWGRYEIKTGMMPVPKVMLTNLMNNAMEHAKKAGLKEAEIAKYRDDMTKEAARIAFNVMKDSVLLMKQSYNFWTVLNVLQEYMKVSGINSDHRIEAGGKHVFVIQHELGENWSLFTKELMTLIFENLAKVKAEISTTHNTTRAEVILKGL
jgi:pantoate kinase